MNIPNLPHIMTPLSMPNGQIHPDWWRYFDQLTNELQINQSEEGTVIPSKSTSDISLIQSNINNIRIINDSTLNVPKISVNGVFKTITTS